MTSAYSIGTAGVPWGLIEKKEWRDSRLKQRSYFDDVVTRIDTNFRNHPLLEVVQYGTLQNPTANDEDFPLWIIRSKDWSSSKPNVLITGGVHGYETSGVEGALEFLERKYGEYGSKFNILVAPCISPWAYERIQRWNSNAVDPNRSFNPNGQVVEGRSFNPEPATDESSSLLQFLDTHYKDVEWICHLDLHETTDTDETEFRPAKAARDGILGDEKGEIPDGFYLVQDETDPQPQWFAAMIEAVRQVTHIAPSDKDGLIIGERTSQEGVIQIPCKKDLGLCAGLTNAPYRTTTEVYPDSPKATPQQCNLAQVTCISAALDYIQLHHKK